MGQGQLAYIVPVNMPEGGAPGTPSHPISGIGGPSHPITLPPLPPGTAPGHPIVLPPGGEEPSYPIFIPGTPAHPIAGPPITPEHPIAPGAPGTPTHPIAGPPITPEHPIALPPGTVWPPLDPSDGVDGTVWLLVWVVGTKRHRWIKVDVGGGVGKPPDWGKPPDGKPPVAQPK